MRIIVTHSIRFLPAGIGIYQRSDADTFARSGIVHIDFPAIHCRQRTHTSFCIAFGNEIIKCNQIFQRTVFRIRIEFFQ